LKITSKSTIFVDISYFRRESISTENDECWHLSMSDRGRYLYRKTVKGNSHLFFRYRGKLKPLPLDESSVEFQRAYDVALQEAKLFRAMFHRPSRRRDARVDPLRDTLDAAIDKYLDSAAFDALTRSSKLQYQHTLKQLRARLGTGRLADLDIDAIDIYTDELAKEHGTSVADRHMRLISKIWKVCRKFPQFSLKGKLNPTLEADKHYVVRQRHRPWPRHLQDAFMAGASDNLKLAKLLLHFSAQRGSDCVKMKWSDYNGKGIIVRPRKTHGEAEALPNYHLCPKPLREALERAPRVAETILVNAHGKSYASANVLSHAFKRELVRLGLAKPGERSLVMHGLRKTAASDVGSLGVGAAGVKTIGGWRTDREANYYAQHADTRRLNALVVQQWDAELERQQSEANDRTEVAAPKEQSVEAKRFQVIEGGRVN
jgi:integrase